MKLATPRRGPAANARAGGALVMTLIVAGVVAILSAAILQLTMGYTRKEVYVEHDTRAFYLAEAGIAEAYRSLSHGGTGQIGSRANPAGSGDGLLWVDATERDEGVVELECTALVGLGRATLAVVVDRDEVPVGFFSNRGITISAPVMLDGYDSTVAPYIEQTDVGSREGLTILPLQEFFGCYGDVWPYEYLEHSGANYLLVDRDNDYAYLLPSGGEPAPVLTDPQLVCAFDGAADCKKALAAKPKDVADGHVLVPVETAVPSLGGGFTYLESSFASATLDSATLDSATTMEVSGGSLVGDLPHTAGGTRLVSNGSVHLESSAIEVYGDVLPGPDGSVVQSGSALVTGSTAPRARELQLEPVVVPVRTPEAAVDHGSLLPWVAPEGDSAFGGLRVQAGCEAILRGPATIVLGALELQAGAKLTIENTAGTVVLYVLGDVTLALDSIVEVESDRPGQLNLLGSGAGSVFDLDATSRFHGLVYAPESTVTIGERFEVFGAAIADQLVLAPNARLHFDSGATSGAVNLPRLIFWEISEIPADIAARRADAFQLLGFDRTLLDEPGDLTLSHSWTARIEYLTGPSGKGGTGGTPQVYEGPFEEFTFGHMHTFVSIELTPPDIAHATPWTARIDCKVAGVYTSFEGPVADFPFASVDFLERIDLTPPDELLSKGFAPTSAVW